jgi:anti-sigma B factor antagonist
MLAMDLDAQGRVVMNGRLDASQAAAAQSFLDQRSGRVVLDCAALEYLSSAGLGVLLKTHKRLAAAGGSLSLVRVGKHLNELFTLSGFNHILDIEPHG